MELLTRIAWLLLVLLHTPPAAVVFAPSLLEKLYGVPPTGDLGIWLRIAVSTLSSASSRRSISGGSTASARGPRPLGSPSSRPACGITCARGPGTRFVTDRDP